MSLLSLLPPRRPSPAPCVAVVVTDGPDAVPLVQRALRAAEDEHLPLLLLVPLPGSGSAEDRRRAADAAAVLGRVHPTLARSHVETAYRVVLHADRTGSRRQVAVAGAVRDAARREGAVLLVAPERLPVLPHGLRVLRVPCSAPVPAASPA